MTPLSPDDRQLIYHMRYEEQRRWPFIYALFPNHLKPSLRRVGWEEKQKRGPSSDTIPSPRIEGATIAEGDDVNEDEVWRLALQKAAKRRQVEERKQDGIVEFDRGPVCLVMMADQHAGNTGTDYARIDNDTQLVLDTPGMYVMQVGDVLDNFIIGRLKDIRLGTSFTIGEEWVLAKRVLRLLAPKLLVSISGNHDLWTYALTGIDYLKEIHKQLSPDILYEKWDSSFILSVEGNEYTVRARHSWRGNSQYNDTHGIERAAKFDKGKHFDIGIGAHTHASGLYRQFNNGGRTGHAILCGSYKTFDTYAERMGFPMANESAAIAMVFTAEGCWGTNDLEIAADYMRTMYDE